jgi:hypothetical protein
MKSFCKETFSIFLFLVVILMIVGTAAANQSWI